MEKPALPQVLAAQRPNLAPPLDFKQPVLVTKISTIDDLKTTSNGMTQAIREELSGRVKRDESEHDNVD